MRELGERIRAAREAQGLSIDELHLRTKIRQRIIEAIESGRFDLIPGGEVYVKGFIKTLAEELNLDYKELMHMWQPISVPPTVVRKKPTYRPSVFPIIGAVVMILALVAAGIYYVYWRPRPNVPPVAEPPQQVNPPPVEEPAEPTVPDVKPPAFVYVGEEGNRHVYEVTSWPLELTVRVTAHTCWVGITADTRSSEVTLAAGQERSFVASDSLLMRLGKAWVTELIVNGEALPGQTGDVRDYTFRKPGP